MKILLKKKILEIIHSMEEANSFLRTVESWETAAGLLATCMQTALKIGTIVENHDDEASKTVKHLNTYCEAAYQLYQCTLDSEEWIRNLGQLDKYVAAIKRSIVEDLSNEKIKVVFLPYNASMWDSFDSVYEAAQKDPDCQVSVVPIPYYSLGPNREIVAEHYEGKEISAYANITDYRAYDIAKECPDMVFIHNPYDEYNNVTQVHPQYFSSQLIKYTSHLVYIPYYISKERVSTVMIFTPGVKNAWKVIVQNEDIRQQYIEAGVDEEKVAALGSPKFDMIYKAEQNKKIPGEWQVLHGKKVFFYNTHLQDIINNGEMFISKLQYVISVFEKHKEAALLWRPHPLSVETIKSMNPSILEEYLNIVDEFKRNGNGVYDDTPDLDRTIAISDAYIGEEQSSVSQLYEVTGKPIFYIRNDSTEFMSDRRYVRALSAQKVKSKIYMFSWEYNCLLAVDEKSGQIELVGKDNKWPIHEQFLYKNSVFYEDSIYFIPIRASGICKYNTQNGKISMISLQTNRITEYNSVIYKNHLYLLPIYYSDCFPCINLLDDSVEYLKTSYKEVLPEGNRINEALFYGEILIESCVYRVCRIGPYVEIFDIEKKTFKYVKVNGLNRSLRYLTYDGKDFWLLAQNDKLLFQWDLSKNSIVKIVDFNSWITVEEMLPISGLFYLNNYLWILLKNCLLQINPLTEVRTLYDFKTLNGFREDHHNCQAFSALLYAEGDSIYFFPLHSNGIMIINSRTQQMRFLKTEINRWEIIDNATSSNGLSENLCNLCDFMQWLDKKETVGCLGRKEKVGTIIWNNLISHYYD